MGVKDLWQLLAPIGRRVSIETLEGKVLAIDASVWIVQFIKALRDENGNMQKNAHVIGTIRRILKLLFHKIKPIFVFDGATPTLKLRTVQARREKKSGHERDQRLVAQRILMSQIKQNLIKAKMKNKDATKNMSSLDPSTSVPEGLYAPSFKPLKQAIANISKDNEKQSSSSSSSSSAVAVEKSLELTTEEEVDIEWEDGYEALNNKYTDNSKQKLGVGDGNNDDDDTYNSEDDINLDLPEDGADIDVKALAALPSYLRKDVIEAARRKERMKSRSTYIPIADDPAMYSQTQIANFLKTRYYY
jgi:DNA excision repair protein ERCC-5